MTDSLPPRSGGDVNLILTERRKVTTMAATYYTIKKNRIKTAYTIGIEPQDDYKTLYLNEEPVRRLYLKAIDSAKEGSQWGRFSFNAELTESMALYVYVAAVDINTIYDKEGTYKIDDIIGSDEVPDTEKKELLRQMGSQRFVGKTDILLYGLEGRYLFLLIEVVGEGTGSLSRLRVDVRGDNFMDTLPEVYRERDGFLHRYLSVFSSLYNDMEDNIDHLPDLLDPDTASVDVLLEFGRWMGIDLSGNFLSEDAIRQLVRESYRLNRMKGTRACLQRIFEIVLGEKVVILEQNTIRAFPGATEMDPRLKDSGIYDVSVLIKKPLSDTDRHQLLHLVRQFVPLRTKLHLIQLKNSGVLDADTYLDMNAVLTEDVLGVFDDNMVMDDDVILDE